MSKNQEIAQTRLEKYILEIYREIDRVTAGELERLKRERVFPSCGKGCSICCVQAIYTNMSEGHVVGQYIKRNFSEYQTNELRTRMSEWFKWVKLELPKHMEKPEDKVGAFYNYGPYCPLLVDGACSIYPVRPVVCRIHYVITSPYLCGHYPDAQGLEGEPVKMTAILNAVQPFVTQIRKGIESTSENIDWSTPLLPQRLAMELGWNDLLL